MLIIPLKTLLGWQPCWACDPKPDCPTVDDSGPCNCYSEEPLMKRARVALRNNPTALAELESGTLTSAGIESLEPRDCWACDPKPDCPTVDDSGPCNCYSEEPLMKHLATEDVNWLRLMIGSYGVVHPADQYNVTLLLPIGTYTAEPLNPELDL